MANVDEATKDTLSVIATTSSRLKDLLIKNGQLIFIQDKGRIAFDFDNKRVFYNQIVELDTEYERSSLSSPSFGYYFIIETAVLWLYRDEWIQITTQPEDIVFIGTEMPQLGKNKTLYVDKVNKEISVWDKDANGYVVVADKTDIADTPEISIETVSQSDIDALF